MHRRVRSANAKPLGRHHFFEKGGPLVFGGGFEPLLKLPDGLDVPPGIGQVVCDTEGDFEVAPVVFGDLARGGRKADVEVAQRDDVDTVDLAGGFGSVSEAAETAER